jgi:hypothetical protein
MSAPSGEQLYNELCQAAAARGVSLASFCAPLFNGASWKIEQLRIAKAPKLATVARVRALIAGEPLPLATWSGRPPADPRHLTMTRAAAEAAGIPPSGRSQYERHLLDQQTAARARTDWQMALSEEARLSRKPGQTVADRFCELRREHGA